MKKVLGLSITEALIALMIFGIGLAVIAPIFVSNSRINRQQEVRTGAVAAAQQVLDTLRFRNFGQWPASATEQQIDTDMGVFNATINWCESGGDCLAITGTRHVTVSIQFNGKQVYEVETVYTQVN